MKIDILTLFPEMFRGPFDKSIIGRARKKNLAKINIHNLRDWATDKHRSVDDRPFGGGAGMVLKVDVVYRALNTLKSQIPPASPGSPGRANPKFPRPRPAHRGGQIQNSKHEQLRTKNSKQRTILLTPQGQPFRQATARRLSKLDHLILLCGHYEGFDERIREHLVDEEVSIGDFVLTGGELPAMVVVDAVVRLLPEVLEKPEATQYESFSKLEIGNWKIGKLKAKGLLEYPQYTRPAEFKGWKVPEILLGGNHAKIEKWRAKQALKRTRSRRPDLIKKPKSDKIPGV